MKVIECEQPLGCNPVAALTKQTCREVQMAVAQSTAAKYLLSNYEMSDREIAAAIGFSKHTVSVARKRLEQSGTIPAREPNYRKRGIRLQDGEAMSQDYPGFVSMPCGRFRRPCVSSGGFRVNRYYGLSVCPVCESTNLLSLRSSSSKPVNAPCSTKCRQSLNTGRSRVLKRDRGPDYRVVYMPSHHRADRTGNVREHILVAEGHLGRKIEKSEPIHHIDCDGLNNDPDNLHVFPSNGAHKRSHGSLNQCVKSLLKSGAIIFNRQTGMYELP